MKYDPSVPMPWVPVILITLGLLVFGTIFALFPEKLSRYDYWTRFWERLSGRRWMVDAYRSQGILMLMMAALFFLLLCYVAVMKLSG